LDWAGPQVLQQSGQEIVVRITRSQVHPDTSAGFPDASPDLQGIEPQRLGWEADRFLRGGGIAAETGKKTSEIELITADCFHKGIHTENLFSFELQNVGIGPSLLGCFLNNLG
jgi:hypothetical protein